LYSKLVGYIVGSIGIVKPVHYTPSFIVKVSNTYGGDLKDKQSRERKKILVQYIYVY